MADPFHNTPEIMGRLTTHVLDTARGVPAGGLLIELWSTDPVPIRLETVRTNADGRTDKPLLEGEGLKAGRYELHFHVGDYHRKAGTAISDPPFLEIVPVRFGIADGSAHYHVPLLLSPYGYSTYRGS
jgi:5-hydroxyisourate hydrolase